MTKVDFQVLCLQVGGSRKISEVQVRVCYYWQRLFSFTYVQVKFVLADAVFFVELCKDYVVLVLIFLVLIRHPCVLIVSE